MKHINTFNEGLDFDTSKNKRSNATYYDALDLRIISDEALSNGALVNFKGTKSKIDLFDRDHKLIGYCQIRNTLVLFIFQDILPTGISLIYKVDLDSTDAIQIPVLVYSDELSTTKLNFPSDGKISAKSRYEASSIQKVYWVDGVNQLRSININDYSVVNGVTINNNLGREASSFDSIPPNDMSGSISTEIINGAGSYNSGVVFYAYQFYKKNGAASTIHKSQYPVKLSSYSNNSDGGGDLGEDSKCSVIVNISDISTQAISLYDKIRVYSVFYEEPEAPSVNIVAERPIRSNVSVLDDGNPIGSMSNEEFAFYKESSYAPKLIESKDNILFLGDINENTFTSEALDKWDARAYRFNSLGIARIGTADDDSLKDLYLDSTFKSTVNVPSLGVKIGDNIPDDYDCYNKYNKVYEQSLLERISNYDTRYNLNGDLGGEGINVEYSFEEELSRIIDDVGSDSVFEDKEFVKTNQSDSYYYNLGNSVDIVECEDGEVYRVGIQFFNSKGQSSFVKWVGDILWEESLYRSHLRRVEIFTGTDREGSASRPKILKIKLKNNANLQALIASGIKSWRVVRAKRTSLDKTPVANGIFYQLHKFQSGDSEYRPFNDSNLKVYNDNKSSNDIYTSDLFKFVSPDTMFNFSKDTRIDGYKVRIYNKSSNKAGAQYPVLFGSKTSVLSKKSKTLTSLNTSSTLQAFHNLLNIEDYKYLEPVHITDILSNEIATIGGYSVINQVQYPEKHIAGGCSSYVIKLDNSIYTEGTDLTDEESWFYGSIIANKDRTRYGGVAYQDILDTEYIPFSEVNSMDALESLAIYGDCYITPFYYLNAIFRDKMGDDWYPFDELHSFPVHSSIDLRRRNDRILEYFTGVNSATAGAELDDVMHPQETVEEGVKNQGTLYDTSIGDLYVYNNAYSAINDLSISISKPVDFVEYGFNDAKVIASDKKVNTEDIDSWTNFGINEFIEVDSEYGSLNELMFHKNNMYFFQDNAIGLLAINDRSLISGDSNVKLSLGTGGVLERFDYINTNVGAISKNHLVKTKENIFIVDVLNKGVYTVSDLSKSLSSEAGVSSFVKSKINELGKDSVIAIGYDKEFNEIIFTINGESIVYSDSTKKFTSKYSTAPKFFISLNDRLMSYVDDETSTGTARYVYQHNLGDYGEYYSEAYQDGGLNLSTLKLSILVNPNNILINRFDVIDFRTDVIEGPDRIAIDRMSFENSYITPIVKNIVTSGQYKNTSFLITGFRTQVPLTSNGNRFVDSYMIVSFEFDNRNNIPFRLHDVMTFYENSKR